MSLSHPQHTPAPLLLSCFPSRLYVWMVSKSCATRSLLFPSITLARLDFAILSDSPASQKLQKFLFSMVSFSVACGLPDLPLQHLLFPATVPGAHSCSLQTSGPASPAREAGRACCRQEGAADDSQPSWLQGHGHPVCVEPGEQEPLQEGFNPTSELAGGHSCPARGNAEPQDLLEMPHPTPGYQRSCLGGCFCPLCAAPGARADSWNLIELDNHHYYF